MGGMVQVRRNRLRRTGSGVGEESVQGLKHLGWDVERLDDSKPKTRLNWHRLGDNEVKNVTATQRASVCRTVAKYWEKTALVPEAVLR